MGSDGKASLRAPLTVRMEGPAADRHRILLQDLVLFGQHLQTAIDRVARLLTGQRASVQAGRPPPAIKTACSLEVVELRGGSVTMVCDLPAQSQPTLFYDLGEEALARFVQGVEVLARGQDAMPKGFDAGVLLALRESGKLLDHGIDRISFEFETRGRRSASCYTRLVHERVVARIQAPVENRRTLEGRLLMGDLKETGRRCRVHPPVGKPVECVFGEVQKDAVLAALTRYVRLVGEATEAEGEIRLFRIEDLEVLNRDETEGITEGTETFFDASTSLQALAAQQGVAPVADFEALLGDFWPPEETADQFIATVREWRHEPE